MAVLRQRKLTEHTRLLPSSSPSSSLGAAAAALANTPSMNEGGSLVPDYLSNSSLLWNWASHHETSFHHFTPLEASAIRDVLLSWYRANRRKLPWRGDPPPFDGSTAGIATSHGVTTAKASSRPKKRNDNESQTKNQTNLHGFFAAKKHSGGSHVTDSSQARACHVVHIDADDNDLSMSATPAPMPVTAYGVWVSEIMLQQTRVEAVIPYWIKWMESFPTVEALATATKEQVNAHWAGLGFYRRARLLHQGAQYVVNELNGKLPSTAQELQQIGGIGPYTAAAIASIAFDECVPVVDGNVCRVLSRLRGICHHIKAPIFKDRYAWKLARQIVEAGNGQHAGEVNQALMELGATYCAPAASGMDDRDPLKPFYMSTRLAQEYASLRRDDPHTLSRLEQSLASNDGNGCKVCDAGGVRTVLENLLEGLNQLDSSYKSNSQSIEPIAIGRCGHSVFPMAPPKSAKREEVLAVLALKCARVDSTTKQRDDCWLLVKRPRDGLLAGQWEFPSVCVWNSDNQSKKERGQSRKDMSTQVPVIDASERSKALSVLLNELSPGHEGIFDCVRDQLEFPIEHIFSHVRHTMWIEIASTIQHDDDNETQLQWISPNGREVRWMSETDMNSVGVTSGVKRIIKTVNQKSATNVKSKKRKR